MMSIIYIIIAYLIGSIPSAVLVCKAMNLPDPRQGGSGNPGATNVLRTAGKLPAILVLVADMLKGFIPVFLAGMFGITGFMLAVILVVAVIGHMFPVFAKFQGGKGIATTFGGALFLSPSIAVITLIVWAILVAATRYVSLASLVSTVLVTILLLFVNVAYFLPMAVLTGLIAWRHIDNIERLKAGTENKIDLNEYK
jgi:glycerol-3-phosphate acyltransferase PlsY